VYLYELRKYIGAAKFLRIVESAGDKMQFLKAVHLDADGDVVRVTTTDPARAQTFTFDAIVKIEWVKDPTLTADESADRLNREYASYAVEVVETRWSDESVKMISDALARVRPATPEQEV
jgi:hypothetical protein